MFDRGEPVPITVRLRDVEATEEEASHGITPLLAEVVIEDVPVHGARILVHRNAPYEHTRRHARQIAARGFAARLADLLGYEEQS